MAGLAILNQSGIPQSGEAAAGQTAESDEAAAGHTAVAHDITILSALPGSRDLLHTHRNYKFQILRNLVVLAVNSKFRG